MGLEETKMSLRRGSYNCFVLVKRNDTAIRMIQIHTDLVTDSPNVAAFVVSRDIHFHELGNTTIFAANAVFFDDLLS